MRWGCCGCMISPTGDPVGIGIIELLSEIGYDYVELSLSDFTVMSDLEFAGMTRRIEQSGIRCEACNNFFPRTIRLTGEEARLQSALDYAAKALDRAARLGAGIIVFGSSGAKNVPLGFSRDTAWRQIVELLRHLGPMAAQHHLIIAIEPINREESNMINLAAEGLRMAREVDHPNIQLLIDYYHLSMEREDHAILAEAGTAIRHLHFAKVEGRSFPLEATPAHRQFFAEMRHIQYSGRCSIEAFTGDFPAEARCALRILKQEAERADTE
jgi:D-psicose/D-tagatose/L-ribulose 3-epimerase